MRYKIPYIFYTRGDILVLNRPMIFDAVIFWNGEETQAQPITVTVVTSVLIPDLMNFQSQIIGLLGALQYLGMHVELPYALAMGDSEMTIVVEKTK